MESIILHIETSTKACSVAISKGIDLLSVVESIEIDYSHAEMLNVFIDKALKEANVEMSDLSAIAVSKGPGSFTGLRIGVSSAKGFAYALSVPLISCSTLDCLATGFIGANDVSDKDIVISMIDARRKEVYMKMFDSQGNALSKIEAKIIDENSFNDWREEGRIIHLVGDGADKFSTEFYQNDAVIIHEGIYPTAAHMLGSAFESFTNKTFEDIAYFEPFYLKDFIAIKPRKLF